MASIKGVAVKNYKHRETRRGLAYSANIYIGTKKIGTVENSGDGGATDIRFLERKYQEEFETRMKEYFKEEPNKDENDETFVEELISLWEHERVYKKHKPAVLVVGYTYDSYTPYEEMVKDMGPKYFTSPSDDALETLLESKKEWKRTLIFKDVKDFNRFPYKK